MKHTQEELNNIVKIVEEIENDDLTDDLSNEYEKIKSGSISINPSENYKKTGDCELTIHEGDDCYEYNRNGGFWSETDDLNVKGI